MSTGSSRELEGSPAMRNAQYTELTSKQDGRAHDKPPEAIKWLRSI